MQSFSIYLPRAAGKFFWTLVGTDEQYALFPSTDLVVVLGRVFLATFFFNVEHMQVISSFLLENSTDGYALEYVNWIVQSAANLFFSPYLGKP